VHRSRLCRILPQFSSVHYSFFSFIFFCGCSCLCTKNRAAAGCSSWCHVLGKTWFPITQYIFVLIHPLTLDGKDALLPFVLYADFIHPFIFVFFKRVTRMCKLAVVVALAHIVWPTACWCQHRGEGVHSERCFQCKFVISPQIGPFRSDMTHIYIQQAQLTGLSE
jgi:hypothetical protein